MSKTKTIVIGQQKISELKPIELLLVFDHESCNFDTGASSDPGDFGYVELIAPTFVGQLDLIFAYDDLSRRNEGVLYLGFWNDGIVE